MICFKLDWYFFLLCVKGCYFFLRVLPPPKVIHIYLFFINNKKNISGSDTYNSWNAFFFLFLG